jgi:hypothetical protein
MFLEALCHDRLEGLVVAVLLEKSQPRHRPIEHMVYETAGSNAWTPRHPARLPGSPKPVKKKSCVPFSAHEDADTVILLDNHLKQGTHQGNSMHVRFTNGHFQNTMTAKVFWENFGDPLHTTTLELVGCRGVSALTDGVTLKGHGTDGKVVFIVRDCEIEDVEDLIDTTGGSVNYLAYGTDNWTFPHGVVADTQATG